MLSGLLITLLVCGSSWAAACDLSCELHRAMPACTASQDVPAAMTQCHGMAMERTPGQTVSAACSGVVCGHQLLPAERAIVDSFGSLWSASQPVSPGVVLDVPRVPMGRVTLALPRGDPDGFDPLLVSLRV